MKPLTLLQPNTKSSKSKLSATHGWVSRTVRNRFIIFARSQICVLTVAAKTLLKSNESPTFLLTHNFSLLSLTVENGQADTHCKRIAEFAVEAVEAASKIRIDSDDEAKGYVKIRVGFHSGSVVSNVIGSLNPRYGLFGDTVNTASRMESNSRPGRIHCSEDAAVILQEQAPNMPLKQRGKINVKGKGLMTTYWVGKGMHGLGHSESGVVDDHTMVASNTKDDKPKVSFPELSPHSSMMADGDSGFNGKKAIGHLEVTHIDMTGDVGNDRNNNDMSAPDLDNLDIEDVTEDPGDFLTPEQASDVEAVVSSSPTPVVSPVPPPAPTSSKSNEGSSNSRRRAATPDPPDSLTQTKLHINENRAEFHRQSSGAGAA